MTSATLFLIFVGILLILSLAALGAFIWSARQRSAQRQSVRRMMQELEAKLADANAPARFRQEVRSDLAERINRLSERIGLDQLVVQAGVATSADVYLLASLLIGGGAGVLLLAVTGSLAAFLVGTLVFALLPALRLLRLRDNRIRLFDEQLPDALDFMGGALRAGHGLAQSFQMIAEEMPSPIGDEFRLVNEKIAFGLTFQDAINQMRDRVPSRDLDFLVVGLLIQRETGGNIAELFMNLAQLGRERFKLAGKIRVLSSEGKLSGWMLGALPFVLGMLMTLLSPAYMAPLWSTDRGQTLVLIGLGMMGIGFVWMSQMVRIKV